MLVPNYVSIPLEIVEIHRIDLQHVDENDEAHFSTGSVYLHCEHLSVSSLLKLLEPECVAERRVPGLAQKSFRIIILVVANRNSPQHHFQCLGDVKCAAVRLVPISAAVSTCSFAGR